MKLSKIQEKVLNNLIDKYESSKSFTGDNKVNQSFMIQPSKLFPKYNEDSNFDDFIAVSEALEELEYLGVVSIEKQRNNIINRVSLNVIKIEESYELLGRVSKAAEHKWLCSLWEELDFISSSLILTKYVQEQRLRMNRNASINYYDGARQDYVDLLQLVYHVETNSLERFVRELSVKLFGLSKRVEELKHKAQGLMFQYGDFVERESVFDECGVVKTPTYVIVKGKAKIHFQHTVIDLQYIPGDISLSTITLSNISFIDVTGTKVVTVENLTSFHDYQGEDALVIYLGGFHNQVKREFLQEVYKGNKSLEYYHFGDIDPGGFYILEHLKNKTNIPFMPLYMDIEVLKQYHEKWQPLSKNDSERLKRMLDDESFQYKEVVNFMLMHNCKLEQENVLIGTNQKII
jgi:hypothetical protein